MIKQSKIIDVIPYDSLWPKIFQAEASLLEKLLQDNCLEIHHIGSTSIPGLAAKPIIDIIALVKNPEKAIHYSNFITTFTKENTIFHSVIFSIKKSCKN